MFGFSYGYLHTVCCTVELIYPINHYQAFTIFSKLESIDWFKVSSQWCEGRLVGGHILVGTIV